MNHFDLDDKYASDSEKRAFLVDVATTAITIRIPKNLKDSIADAASPKVLSFSAYMRTCLMNSLIESK